MTQSLETGDKVYEMIEEATEDANDSTSHRFTGLTNEQNHSYAYEVYAIYKRYFDTAWSERSERKEVSLNSSGVNLVEVAPTGITEVARYSIDGCRINKGVRGLNIVKYSDGSVRKVFIK